MRIVGGKSKGRRIKVPKKGTRPTKGIVRGAIFNIIGAKICAAEVLDIFAGSGALGLEAISRGAKSCVFIETNPKSLFENIKNLYAHDQQIKVIKNDFRFGLKILNNRQFDIIFIDPPYYKNYLQKTIELIAFYQLLKHNGIAVLEHHFTERLILPEAFSLYKQKKYGETMLTFIIKDDMTTS